MHFHLEVTNTLALLNLYHHHHVLHSLIIFTFIVPLILIQDYKDDDQVQVMIEGTGRETLVVTCAHVRLLPCLFSLL